MTHLFDGTEGYTHMPAVKNNHIYSFKYNIISISIGGTIDHEMNLNSLKLQWLHRFC